MKMKGYKEKSIRNIRKKKKRKEHNPCPKRHPKYLTWYKITKTRINHSLISSSFPGHIIDLFKTALR